MLPEELEELRKGRHRPLNEEALRDQNTELRNFTLDVLNAIDWSYRDGDLEAAVVYIQELQKNAGGRSIATDKQLREAADRVMERWGPMLKKMGENPFDPDELVEPECPLGYTWDECKKILGDRADAFNTWMYGQTMGVCEEHGSPIIYKGDLARFLSGLPVVD